MSYFRAQLRHERYDEIYVSPHMDDAAYSCGGRILQSRARGARVLVLTIFGTGQAQTAIQSQAHFTDYGARAAEELAVMQRLDADFIWLDYPELLFRKNSLWDVARFFVPFMRLSGRTQDELLEATLEVLARYLAPEGQVFFPLSVGFHPDHRLLFDIGRAIHALSRFQVAFYEDVPYSLIPPLTALQLRFLSVKTSLSLAGAATELNRFWLREYGKLGSYLWLPLVLYLGCLVAARRLMGWLDRRRREPPPQRMACEIADVIGEKADIMRLYPSQTQYFFSTLDESLVDRIKVDGHAREHTWLFPTARDPEQRLTAAQQALVDKLLQPPPFARERDR
jgi:LmbE family N-acetylglucosaminyl deacetylase